ncbi:MAG: hypothetical protein IJG37_09300 [Synergistaceae bacterium]|nr:hypothetical protein [Synergistaceae bacterium]MBQ7168439.1 hypothetical protein [Synergistaceae bacterium]
MTLREKIEANNREDENYSVQDKGPVWAFKVMLTVYAVSTVIAFMIIRIWG